MQQERDNSGVLFKNDKKESEKQPDYTGNCVVGGIPMQLAAWIKTSSKGTKFMSLSFKPKEATSQVTKKKPDAFDDDSIPF